MLLPFSQIILCIVNTCIEMYIKKTDWGDPDSSYGHGGCQFFCINVNNCKDLIRNRLWFIQDTIPCET